VLTVKGKHIFVDPAPVEEKGNAIAEFKALPKADAIIYTHSHYDHFNAGILEAILVPETAILAPADVVANAPQSLRDRFHAMAYGDKTELFGVAVEAIAMYNTTPERTKFHPKGFGNGYVLTVGGKRIYIAGDTEETPEITHLPSIDAAFIPVNLPYTMSVEAAAHWVKDFKPGVVYPYHYRNGDGTLSDMKAFATDVGSASNVKILKWY
jgi:L-ascorbate metabolism protein UlaG (beta-lactamase superfamily)